MRKAKIKKTVWLTPTQAKERFSKKRAKESIAKKRIQECFKTKIDSMISMIRLAITKGIRFDYLLVDSWFYMFRIGSIYQNQKNWLPLIRNDKNGNHKVFI